MKINEIMKSTGSSISRFAGRTSFKVQKYSPEILLGLGIVGFVGTVVTACKATLKAEEVLDEHREKMEAIEEAKELANSPKIENSEGELLHPEQEYDDKDYKRDKLIQYTKTTVNFGKLYAPTIALGSLSLACILVSRNIMKKRYLGAVAAYNAVSTAFEEYRKRVREEAGELMDRHYRYGTELETITVTEVDENGKKKKVEVVTEKPGTVQIPEDGTARFFDETNRYWEKNPELNMMFLRGQQNYLNDLLKTRGHVWLNEVYTALGYDHTQAGAVLGWVLGDGDGFIDFGLYKHQNGAKFVNGEQGYVLLEFNHDGPIWEKI